MNNNNAWSDNDKAVMSYYSDDVLSSLMTSLIRDLKMIPFFNQSISQSSFYPRLDKFIEVSQLRFSKDDTRTPKNLHTITVESNTWEKVNALEELIGNIELESKPRAEAERAARIEAKKKKGQEKAAAARAARSNLNN